MFLWEVEGRVWWAFFEKSRVSCAAILKEWMLHQIKVNLYEISNWVYGVSHVFNLL